MRVIHNPISDYERYACEWGYVNNVRAGEPTRVLDLATAPVPDELRDAPDDWWLIDRARLVAMYYRPDGSFTGARLIDHTATVELHCRAADAAWHAAEDFTTWWTAHPGYRRAARNTA